MAVTYGFYNALSHDRLYDAIQMSSLFDGIIRDGVFSTIGTSLIVTSPEDGFYVNVGPGRCWFNHSWLLNDTEYPIEAEQSEVVLDRYDAVVVEINSSADVRANSIKFVKGTPSANPVKPTLTHNAEVNQYALAYVHIRAGQTTIFQADIENVVGTDETPFVTGLLQQLSIENIILQWEAEFDDHFSNWVTVNEATYQTWTTNMQNQYTAWMNNKMSEYATWYNQMKAEGATDLAEFDAWFQSMKDQLSTDAAGHLQAEIDALAADAEKGSVVTVTTTNSTLYGRTVTVSQDGNSRSATFDNSGVAVFESIPFVGTVTISSTDGSQTASTTLNIPYFGRYSATIAFWAATVNVTTTSTEFYGKTIKVSKDGTVVANIIFDNSGRATYTAGSTGTYKFTVTYDGSDFDQSVSVTEQTTYNVVINAWIATLNMNATISSLYNRAITISKGGTTVGTTAFDSSGKATYKVHETGTYTVSATASDGRTYTKTVNVTAQQGYNVDLGTVTKSITIYSAANDTVSFTDAAGAKTVTTNSSGQGTASVTVIPSGTSITFTSAVAKNPSNLGAAYSKTVTVTENTTSVAVMPDGALYWWGWINGIEDCTTANGWSGGSNTLNAPTHNTNSIRLSYPGYANQYSAIAISAKQTANKAINLIYNGVTPRSNGIYLVAAEYTSKSMTAAATSATYSNGNVNTKAYTMTGANYFTLNGNGMTSDIYAIWV